MSHPTPVGPVEKARSYARQRLARVRPGTVLYSAFDGRYADNPRGVYEALVRRAPELDHVWHLRAGVELPAGTRGVSLGDRAWPAELGQAQLVVANASVPQYVHGRGATYLQTWHGTPLKRIGLENPQRRSGSASYRRAVRDYAQWDLLVSQNPHSTEVFRRAFAYDGEVLEVGYPRNDVLASPEAQELGRLTRARLGIGDRRALLYVPTWRDDQLGRAFRLGLDLARLTQALGPDTVLLLRLHHWMSAELAPVPGVLDVSGHPDIRELYLAADALVTDYSSAAFDFAVTGKPIVLYLYDLEHYRDALRGLYFDVVDAAPGPVCRTQDELTEVLADLPAPGAAYREYQQRFCPWDDGHAGDRVVDRVLPLVQR